MANPKRSKVRSGRTSEAAIAAAAAVVPDSPGLVALIFGRSDVGATLRLVSESFTLQAVPNEFDATVCGFVDAKGTIVATRDTLSKAWHVSEAKGTWTLRNGELAVADAD